MFRLYGSGKLCIQRPVSQFESDVRFTVRVWCSGGALLFTFGSEIVCLSQAWSWVFPIDVMHSLGPGLKAKLK